MRRWIGIVAALVVSMLLTGSPAMGKQNVAVEVFYNNVWNDHTTDLYRRNPITINRAAGSEQTGVVPTDGTLTFQTRDGRMNPDNVRSPLFGLIGEKTPIRVKVDGDIRLSGRAVKWSPRRSLGGQKFDAWVVVTIAGKVRELGQGEQPSLRSPMFRTVAGVAAGGFLPLAYVPMEDGKDASQFASGLPGGQAATFVGSVAPAAYAGAAGSAPVPILNDGGTITGQFPSTTLVPDGSGNTIAQMQFMAMVPSSLSADANFLDVDVPPTGGDNVTLLRVVWQHSSTALQLRWYNAAFVPVGFAQIDFATLPELFDSPALFAITMSTDVVGSPGAVNVFFTVFRAGSPVPFAFDFGSFTAPAVPVPQGWRAMATAGNAGWAFGHWALYTDPAAINVSGVQDNARALDGWRGEAAGRRFIRLCTEESIAYVIVGDPDDTQPMGPQPMETLLKNFEDVAKTDTGLIFDTRVAEGLTLRTGRTFYNQ